MTRLWHFLGDVRRKLGRFIAHEAPVVIRLSREELQSVVAAVIADLLKEHEK